MVQAEEVGLLIGLPTLVLELGVVAVAEAEAEAVANQDKAMGVMVVVQEK